MITTTYPKEYQCSIQIKNYIKEKYDQNISGEELAYLTVHIKRICTFGEEK